jgi:DNA (cytosine-5)-methyltransferase 1
VVRGGDPGPEVDADRTTEARVMRLKGYGNAIVPAVAAEFIGAYLDTEAA